MADGSNEAQTLNGHIIAQPSDPPKDPSLTAPSQLSRTHDNPASSPPHISPPPQQLHSQSASTTSSPSTQPAAAFADAVNRNASASRATDTSHMAENGGPSPYGTRSRNRNGNARPNYAEDRDLDGEVEWTSSKKPNATSKTNPAHETPPDLEKSSGVSTRRSSAVTLPSATKPAPSQTIKDNLPGMSSFALQSESGAMTASQSKKRKAPGISTSAAATPQQGLPATTNGTVKRSLGTSSTHAERETNMMTFEKSGGKLKHGKLIADDETILKVHGKHS